MLFHGLTFALLFLPLVLGGLHLLARRGHPAAPVAWLSAASLLFYALGASHSALALLLGSMLVNHRLGLWLADGLAAQRPAGRQRALLLLAVGANLALLAWFKYAGMLVQWAAALRGSPWAFAAPVLPLGISFYCFTQIAWLVDASRGRVAGRALGPYLLFVSYFPHLIAGPILHHAAMIPQFMAPGFGRLRARALVGGLALFSIGLAKKVLLADPMGAYANPVFDAAHHPGLGSSDAWLGALAYTAQIYFDFSGYSDMAIGLARMMGVQLPENFNAPYRASDISSFWRRWHISLSAFLRDYLYIPLGGNRHGWWRQQTNLMLTMLLGGLWHGAGATFVLWGGLHGLYLVLHHGWRRLAGPRGWRLPAPLGWALTMLGVVLAWVLFRAPDVATACALLLRMAGLPATAGGPDAAALASAGPALAFDTARAWAWLALCAGVALALPSTAAWRTRLRPWIDGAAAPAHRLWLALGATVAVLLLLLLVAESAASRSVFIYYNF